MAIDVSLKEVKSGYNTNTINDNFNTIASALSDALSRSGTTPNQMLADLDMNSFDVVNARAVKASAFVLNGEAIVPSDLVSGAFIAIDGSTIPTANVSWGGFKITALGDPTAAQDAATKNYVDTPNTNTDVEIADISNAINTTGKVVGKQTFDTVNNRLMIASGTAAADPWYVADGSASVTPS